MARALTQHKNYFAVLDKHADTDTDTYADTDTDTGTDINMNTNTELKKPQVITPTNKINTIKPNKPVEQTLVCDDIRTQRKPMITDSLKMKSPIVGSINCSSLSVQGPGPGPGPGP